MSSGQPKDRKYVMVEMAERLWGSLSPQTRVMTLTSRKERVKGIHGQKHRKTETLLSVEVMVTLELLKAGGRIGR